MADEKLPFWSIGSVDLNELYKWDFEDAHQAQKRWVQDHPDAYKAQKIWAQENPEVAGPEGIGGPLWQWYSSRFIESFRQEYQQSGDPDVIIITLHECCMSGLPIPKWCAQAFMTSFRDVRGYKAKSWDDVFGRPHPKGTHLDSKRKERVFGVRVYTMIKEIKQEDPSIPIDAALFQRVGEELGIGSKTLTSEYYYSAKRFYERP